MKNLQPTRVRGNKPTNCKPSSWQDDLKILIQNRLKIYKFKFTEDLVEVDDLDKIEILMDFEESHRLHGKVDDNEFVKCKSFCDMVDYLSKFMEGENANASVVPS